MNANIGLTFDVDWAPDWAIALCVDLCASAGVPATFFVTHSCDILADLRRAPDRTELGLHPNFLPGSSHGATPEAVLEHCLALLPEARSMRTHSLVQSTPLLGMVADHTPIDVDVSLFLPFHRFLHATALPVGRSGRMIRRLPYLWEDDIAAGWPGWDWETGGVPTDGGLCILAFHPIHVALNTASLDRYDALKDSLGGRGLASLTEAEAARFHRPGFGVRGFLERLLADIPGHRFSTIAGLAGGAS
ncbi:hypothetical protein [Magnetospirillum sp. SS-4]|uniref:polysaccharide deacetylase WbmS family protein n=1 Tax=Magnetospirillum sp. SS-4 TaxID=2681465 RepID=UPI001572B761|nr:hypothetical protein [Magnetospirillum sp. SS-4]